MDHTYSEFNLNQEIKVILEPEGFIHYMNKTNEGLYDNQQKPLSYFMEKADKKGYVKFQAWHFMEIFGETIHFGRRPIFSNNILICNKDLRKP